MTIILLCLAIIIAAFAWRASRAPIKHRCRRRQARVMCDAFCSCGRSQPPALIYARLRAMDALAFEALLLESFERRGCRVVRSSRYTGDGGIERPVVFDGRIWLIQAKGYAVAIRLEYVQAFARSVLPVVRLARSSTPGAPAQVVATSSVRREKFRWSPGISYWHWSPAVRSRSAGERYDEGARFILVVFMAVPATVRAQGGSMVAEERRIARCIHQSARGKPWLKKTLWGLRDQKGE